MTERRLTVQEAGIALGITPEAVRGRIRRGTLRAMREGGAVYVLLDADQPRPTADQPPDRTDLLIAELQDRIRSLEEANRENRRIIAALTQRIPELPAAEAPPDARGSPEAGEAAEASTQVATEQQAATSRPWWRRVFGG